MSTILGNSIQIKGQCYKNGVEISTEKAIREILEMGSQQEQDRIVKMVKEINPDDHLEFNPATQQRRGWVDGFKKFKKVLLANIKSNE